ncbi:MAG: hypothetical protein LBJ88_00895 [Campylobacteraceae bacterium]|jgi:hypothetical protein|nr:hypothetical protein [Campylobacteraceae bacterium]
MKISIIVKALIIIMLGGFLFLGCGGGGDGQSLCYGDCPNTGDGEDPGDGDGEEETITANLNYSSMEDNITDYRGMFNLVANNQVEPERLDNHSTLYSKEIIYHNVDASIATRLYPLLDGTVYPGGSCSYVNSPPYCQEFQRLYTTLPLDIQMEGIRFVRIVFNQEKTTGCAADSGVCDITLSIDADPRYHNNTNPISLVLFKRTFIDDYFYGSLMESVLYDIEKNATSASTITYTWYHDMNLSTYINVNKTIRLYTDHLPVNNGSKAPTPSPQIPMQSSGDNGEGATLSFNGAYYSLENTYTEFQEDKKSYDVNETNINGPRYWMANVSNRDIFNYITLCQRTANATPTTIDANATNATYTCEEGESNISARWSILGKSVDLDW